MYPPITRLVFVLRGILASIFILLFCRLWIFPRLVSETAALPENTRLVVGSWFFIYVLSCMFFYLVCLCSLCIFLYFFLVLCIYLLNNLTLLTFLSFFLYIPLTSLTYFFLNSSSRHQKIVSLSTQIQQTNKQTNNLMIRQSFSFSILYFFVAVVQAFKYFPLQSTYFNSRDLRMSDDSSSPAIKVIKLSPEEIVNKKVSKFLSVSVPKHQFFVNIMFHSLTYSLVFFIFKSR